MLSDVLLWSPIATDKLKDFWDFIASDSFNCDLPGPHEMDYKKFLEKWGKEVQHKDIPRDDPRQKDFYHCYCTLSFPTMYDCTSQMLMNDFSTKNSVLNALEKDKKLTKDEKQEI